MIRIDSFAPQLQMEQLQRYRRVFHCLVTFFCFGLLSAGLWLTTQIAAAEEATPNGGPPPFTIVSKDPDAAAFAGVILTNTIRATFSESANTNTFAQNFRVWGSQQGRLDGNINYDAGSNTLTFIPERQFAFGERVTVVGTNGIRSAGDVPLTAHQWEFRAGYRADRCIEGFLPNEEFVPVWSSATAWGDFDRDGDLDALVAGKTQGNPLTMVYRNNGDHTFSQTSFGLIGVREGSVAWGDYDNDLDLDILLTGTDTFGTQVARIYRNDNATAFTNINAPIAPVKLGGAQWVDYDNDGRLDVFVHGLSGENSVVHLYRNTGDTFTEVPTTLPGVNNSSADWADFDKDGDADLLLTGSVSSNQLSDIYRNDGGTFTALNAGLDAVGDSAVAWGDYDGDGNVDILLSGRNSLNVPVTQIYHNNGNSTFTNINAALVGVFDGTVEWGDFDNDNDLDLLVGGNDVSENVSTTLYENRGGAFVPVDTVLPGINLGAVSWGDYDGDYDADILLTGLTEDSIITGVYRNFDCPSDVAITQTIVPTMATTGQPVTITLTFTNAGPVTATNVMIEDIVPSGITNLQVNSSSPDSSVQIIDTGENPPYKWRVSNLVLGSGGTITITGDISPTPGEVYTNTAEISAERDITLTDNIATSRIVVPFRVTQHTPTGADTVSTPLDNALGATFETAIRPTTVNAQSLKLYGSHSGYLGYINSSYNPTTRTFIFRANRDFVQGEAISIVATDAIQSIPGAPLIPHQWQFVAGQVSNRCVGDFQQLDTAFPGMETGSVAWGDYNRDGNADLLIAGQTAQGAITRVYRNDGANRFTDIGAPLVGVRNGVVRWVDYDGDGDLDLFVTGHNGTNAVSNLYRNNNGTFEPVTTGFIAVDNSSADWVDYDNDGWIDLLLSGQSTGGRTTVLYRNNGNGTFTNVNAGLPGLSSGDVAWADYDDDGDLDLLLAGDNGSGSTATLYRNDDGAFTDSGISLTGVRNGAVVWGDYDKDGDPDLLLTGTGNGGRVTELYRNDGGNLTTVATGLPAVDDSSAAWGDFDNDGILDLLLAGATDSGRITTLYHQRNGTFTDFNAGLPGVATGDVAWGDADGDRDLDLLLLGNDGSGTFTHLYRNTDCISDVGISQRAMPAAVQAGDTITFTLVFSNAGPQPALNVVINDLLPADVTNVQVVSSTVGSGVMITDTAAPTGKQWQVSSLALNEGGTITLTGVVAPGVAGQVFFNSANISATHDITLTNNRVEVTIGRPFHITETTPMLASIAYPRNGLLEATFDADVDDFTASDQSIRVYGDQSGLRAGTVGYDELTRRLTFTPTRPLNHGEQIQIIGTDALKSVYNAPLQPYQWHFTAGYVDPERCLAGYDLLEMPFPALRQSAAAWGDYNNDGELDLLVSGSPDGSSRMTKLYRNLEDAYTEIPTTLAAIHSGAVAWGDYDQDGDLDIALAGSSDGGPVAKVYRNDNGTFVDINAALTGVIHSAVAWGDYDNDGDLDLLVSGTADGTNGLSRLYRNDAGIFTDSGVTLTGLYRGSAQWGDYDGDGDLDLLLAGTTDGTNAATKIYRNDGNAMFTDLSTTLPGIYNGEASWDDYDRDSDLDIFLAGQTTGGTRVARLFRNEGNDLFNDVTGSIGFAPISEARVEWGDYDNDGDPDLLLAGTTDGSTSSLQLMVNNGNDSFLATTWGFEAHYDGVALWGDYDGDRDLDLLLNGVGASGVGTRFYRSRDCISDLGITKTATPEMVLPGEMVTYTIDFENTGPQTATRVVLTDLIGANLFTDVSINSSLPVTTVQETPYIWRLPNIPTGQGGTITLAGRTTFTTTGTTINNRVTIFAREDITPTNNEAVATVAVQEPLLSFAAPTVSVDEGAGTATVQVTLDVPNRAGNIMVDYRTRAGTAQSGNDYTDVLGELTIPAGQTAGTFSVPLTDDTLDEDDETIQLLLEDPVGARFGALSQATVTITDNDPLPTLSATGTDVSESAGVAEFRFTLSAVSGRAITLTVNTINDTATAPADFVALTDHVVVIPAGTPSITVPVTLVDDQDGEDNERFFLAVSATNATLSASQLTVTIRDNDENKLYMPIVRR